MELKGTIEEFKQEEERARRFFQWLPWEIMKKKTKLRAYFVRSHKDCEYGVAVIAENRKDAKKRGIESGDIGDIEEYIDVRVSWIKDANTEGLTEGVIDGDVDALKRGLYLYLEDAECPGCGSNVSHLENDKGIVLCEECKEKHKKEE